MSKMRFKEFLDNLAEDLLIEHDIEKTWANYGEKIHKRMKTDPAVGTEDRNDEAAHKGILNHHIETHDPTPQKRYGQWMARMYANGGIKRLEDFGRAGAALGKFHTAVQRTGFMKKHGLNADINSHKSLEHLEDTVDKIPQEETKSEVRDAAQEKARAESTHHEDEHWHTIIPHTEHAAKYYGRGTRWCTAAENHNMFNNYHPQGELCIAVPKKPKYTGEKYQWHVNSGQFMNEKDNEIDVNSHPFEDRPNKYFEDQFK